MAGFKDGSVDAFDEDDDEEDPPQTEIDNREAEGQRERAMSTGDDTPPSEVTVSDTGDTGADSGGLPWLYSRSSITDGRAKTVQLHLQQSTLDEERDVKTDLERQLNGETVNKADLREAAYLAGLARPEAVADILEDWGYGRE